MLRAYGFADRQRVHAFPLEARSLTDKLQHVSEPTVEVAARALFDVAPILGWTGLRRRTTVS